jgi:hypothetical protein
MNNKFLNIHLTLNLNKTTNPLNNINICICNHHITSHNIYTKICDYEHCKCIEFTNKNIILNIDKGVRKKDYWKVIEQEVNLKGLLKL